MGGCLHRQTHVICITSQKPLLTNLEIPGKNITMEWRRHKRQRSYGESIEHHLLILPSVLQYSPGSWIHIWFGVSLRVDWLVSLPATASDHQSWTSIEVKYRCHRTAYTLYDINDTDMPKHNICNRETAIYDIISSYNCQNAFFASSEVFRVLIIDMDPRT